MPIPANTAQPTYFDIRSEIKESGMDQGDLVRVLLNLVVCLTNLGDKLDADGGVTDTNYGEYLTDDMRTACADIATPKGGPVT